MHRFLAIAAFVGTACLLTVVSSAQLLVPPPTEDGSATSPLAVKYQHVQVEIDNQVARTTIEQVFVNSTNRPLEATYLLPIRDEASVYDFAYYVKGKRIAGEIREKGEARRTYDQTVARLRDPAILEQVGRNLFRAQIFPVSPDEPMKVELRYSEILPYDKGRIRYSYPLALAGKAVELGDLCITANIRDGKRIQKVYSEEVEADVIKRGEHQATVSFEATRITPKRDFVLAYEVESEEFGVHFVTYRPDPQRPGYFMAIMCPQETIRQSDVVRKDVIFVFDRSGSMSGEKIEQAKAALKYCVESLTAEDRFSIVTFSSDTEAFRPGLSAATRESKAAAGSFIAGVQARGGTAINAALLEALGMFEATDAQKTIVFCTDGLPTVGETDPKAILASVRAANKQDVHVFCFGVGDDVDDAMLLRLARENRGAEQHVKSGESIEAKVGEFYDKVNTPLLVDLKLDFGRIPVQMQHPKALPDVFKGSQVVVAGRYSEAGGTTLTLRGDLNGAQRVFEHSVDFPSCETENAFVGRVWARARVDALMELVRLEGENPEIKDEVIGLSKEWNIQTAYTSFLAMPDEVAREERVALNQTSPVAPAAPRDMTVGGMMPGMMPGEAGMPGQGPVTTLDTYGAPGMGGGAMGPGMGMPGGMAGPKGDAGPAGPGGPAGPRGERGPVGRQVATEPVASALAEQPLAGSWASDAADMAYRLGVITDDPQTMGSLGDLSLAVAEPSADASGRGVAEAGQVTRYAAALRLWRLLEARGVALTPVPSLSFTDVPSGHPSGDALQMLVDAGVIPAGDLFHGSLPITRRQFAEWVDRALALGTGAQPSADALQALASRGILQGGPGGLRPDAALLAPELVVILARLADALPTAAP